jgi:creatinine amidohydrolase
MLELERLTAAALTAQIRAGTTIAVIPFGSIEQQGAHLPLGADSLLADAVGSRVASRLGALLLPTLRVGDAARHAARPGTLTLQSNTISDTAVQLGQSLARVGVRLIALVSTHGGNAPALQAAVQRLDAAGIAACAPQGDLGPDPGAHSGAWLTSVMLALHPQLVHPELAELDLAGANAERGEKLLERFVTSVVEQVTLKARHQA